MPKHTTTQEQKYRKAYETYLENRFFYLGGNRVGDENRKWRDQIVNTLVEHTIQDPYLFDRFNANPKAFSDKMLSLKYRKTPAETVNQWVEEQKQNLQFATENVNILADLALAKLDEKENRLPAAYPEATTGALAQLPGKNTSQGQIIF